MNHIQTMIKILAEAAFADESKEFHVGSGDDSHVDFNLLCPAQAHEFALLDDAQQLGLRFRADGGDFIEENGALIGDLKETLLGSDSAGERALDVPKKLRLEKIHGNGTGVDGHKRFVRARGGGVDGLGNKLLAGAA